MSQYQQIGTGQCRWIFHCTAWNWGAKAATGLLPLHVVYCFGMDQNATVCNNITPYQAIQTPCSTSSPAKLAHKHLTTSQLRPSKHAQKPDWTSLVRVMMNAGTWAQVHECCNTGFRNLPCPACRPNIVLKILQSPLCAMCPTSCAKMFKNVQIRPRLLEASSTP